MGEKREREIKGERPSDVVLDEVDLCIRCVMGTWQTDENGVCIASRQRLPWQPGGAAASRTGLFT